MMSLDRYRLTALQKAACSDAGVVGSTNEPGPRCVIGDDTCAKAGMERVEAGSSAGGGSSIRLKGLVLFCQRSPRITRLLRSCRSAPSRMMSSFRSCMTLCERQALTRPLGALGAFGFSAGGEHV